MNAFVTGGTGFLGYHIIRQLLDRGWHVRAMHRPTSDIRRLEALGVECVPASLEDRDSLVDAISDETDAVFHAAGDTSLWSVNNRRQTRVNVDGVRNVVDAVLERGVRRLVHTSSISAYGFHEHLITESSPSTALDSGVNYMRTKYLGESIVKQAVAQRRLDAVILNPCAVIGSHDLHNWSRLFVMVNEESLPGIPSGGNSFCYVGGVAAAHINAFDRGGCGENYILAGVEARFLELIRTIGCILDKPVPRKTMPDFLLRVLACAQEGVSWITRKEPDLTPEKAKLATQRRLVVASEKAADELGYDASITLEEMLLDCYRWMRAEHLLEG